MMTDDDSDDDTFLCKAGLPLQMALTSFYVATNQHIDNIVSRQEKRIAEMKPAHEQGINCLKATITDMQESLEFAMAEIKDLKGQLHSLSSSERSLVVERTPMPDKMEDIQKSLQQLIKQTDYLENQSCRNNLRI